MEILKDYQPEFFYPCLPEGEAEEALNDAELTQEEAQKFMAERFIATNEKVSCKRIMDGYEINTLRDKYRTILEEDVPTQEEKVFEAETALTNAKSNAKIQDDLYKALMQNLKDVSRTVKDGTKIHEFGAHQIWKVPVGEQYRWYALIDGILTLVKVQDIPSYEQRDLLNVMNNNKQNYEALRDGAALKVAND